MAGQKSKDVLIRTDLKEMMSELDFAELNLQVDNIAPPIFTKKREGRYPVMPRETRAKIPDTRRSPGGTYQRGEWEWKDDWYTSEEYGYEETVDQISALENEEFVDEELVASELSLEKLLLARESRVATELLDDSKVWTGSKNIITLDNADRWYDNAAEAKIFNVIEQAANIIRSKCIFGKSMLTLTITDDMLGEIFKSAEIKDDTKYTIYLQTLGQQAKAQWLRDYLGIKEVKIVSGIFDTAGLGAEFEAARFWSNNYALLGKLSDGKSNSLMNRNVARQIVWTKHSRDYLLESYSEKKTNRFVYRASEYRGLKINTDYGILIKGLKPSVDSKGL